MSETLRQIAADLFNGYGYASYRVENELRADDQRLRRMVCALLQRARQSVSEAEARWRRDHFPPASRAQPFPPPEAQAGALRLEALAAAVSALDGRINHLPVPDYDVMTRHYRQAAETLRRLSEKDLELVEQAHALVEVVTGASDLLAEAERVEAALTAIRDKVLERQALLV